MLTKQYLKNAYFDGNLCLERRQTFWSQIGNNDCLMGDRKEVGSGVNCQTIKLGENNKSILVCLTDTKGNYWYSWIHAD